MYYKHILSLCWLATTSYLDHTMSSNFFSIPFISISLGSIKLIDMLKLNPWNPIGWNFIIIWIKSQVLQRHLMLPGQSDESEICKRQHLFPCTCLHNNSHLHDHLYRAETLAPNGWYDCSLCTRHCCHHLCELTYLMQNAQGLIGSLFNLFVFCSKKIINPKPRETDQQLGKQVRNCIN